MGIPLDVALRPPGQVLLSACCYSELERTSKEFHFMTPRQRFACEQYSAARAASQHLEVMKPSASLTLVVQGLFYYTKFHLRYPFSKASTPITGEWCTKIVMQLGIHLRFRKMSDNNRLEIRKIPHVVSNHDGSSLAAPRTSDSCMSTKYDWCRHHV